MKCLIFDVDGVLVDSPHEMAWGEALAELMQGPMADLSVRSNYRPESYSTTVYQQILAGRPRMEGARAILNYYQIPDPDGTVAQHYAEHKQGKILDLISKGRFKAFQDAVDLALRADEAGWKLAVASSSKNANAMLEKVELEDGSKLIDLFPANVCGMDFPRGKPDPAIFLAAANAAGAEPGNCWVAEDAPSGVQAAKAGGMKALGVARLNDEKLLEEAKADRVVTDCTDIKIEELD